MKIFATGFLVLSLSCQAFADVDEFSREEVISILNVLMSGRTIVQTFGGKYSTQRARIRNVEFSVGRAEDSEKFWIRAGFNSPYISDLNEIFVDNVSVAEALQNQIPRRVDVGTEMSRQKVLDVVDVLLSGKKIRRTFDGKYSAQTAGPEGFGIYIRKDENRNFVLRVGRYNPPVESLDEILVDGVSVADRLAKKRNCSGL